jgi:hypothetical protein
VLYYNIESGLALAVTLFINVCVISVFAAGFFGRKTEEGEGAVLRWWGSHGAACSCSCPAAPVASAPLPLFLSCDPTEQVLAPPPWFPFPAPTQQRSGWPTPGSTWVPPLAPT